jgi:hypothetical protein
VASEVPWGWGCGLEHGSSTSSLGSGVRGPAELPFLWKNPTKLGEREHQRPSGRKLPKISKSTGGSPDQRLGSPGLGKQATVLGEIWGEQHGLPQVSFCSA